MTAAASRTRRKPRLALLIAIALAVVALGAAVLLRSPAPEQAGISQEEQLGLSVLTLDPSSMAVAADTPFSVQIDNIASATVELSIHGSYGVRQFTALGIDGQATITVPPAPHAESGVVLLVARAGDRVGFRELTLVAGAAVDPIESMLGARTIVANGSDHTMVVSIPVDAQGNPVSTGTAVDWTLTRKGEPSGSSTLTSQTEHLLAFKQIFATTTAGTSTVGPIVNGAHGREASFIEVPGVPIAFDLHLLDPQPVADGRSLVRVRTDELIDQFGNVMLDGTRVSLDVTRAVSSAGTTTGTTVGAPDTPRTEVISRLWGTTQQGRAEFVILAPEQATSLALTARASGAASNQLTIDFPAAVTDIAVELELTDVGVRAHLGPVLTQRDAYVPDGTTATVVAIFDGTGSTTATGASTGPVPVVMEELKVVIDEGVASLLLPATTDRVRVTILGHTVETAVGR